MLFSAPKLILYFKRFSIDIYSDGSKIGTINLPDNIINHLELHNAYEFTKLIQNALEALKIKNTTAVILLSGQVTYFQQIKAQKSQDAENALKSFINTIPFEPNKLSAIYYGTPPQYIVVVANKDLYEPILKVFDQNNISIKYIIPSVIIPGAGQEFVLNNTIIENINKILKSKNGNFLIGNNFTEDKTDNEKDEDDINSEEESGKPTKKHSKYIVATCLLLLIALPVYVMISSGIIPAKYLQFAMGNKTKPSISPTISVTPAKTIIAATSTPAVQTKNRKELTVNILNGSGISGQATLVEGLLKKANFNNITTGNVLRVNTADTIIIFSPNVSQADRKSILDTLRNVVNNIVEKSEDLSSFDISITTGIAKK